MNWAMIQGVERREIGNAEDSGEADVIGLSDLQNVSCRGEGEAQVTR